MKKGWVDKVNASINLPVMILQYSIIISAFKIDA